MTKRKDKDARARAREARLAEQREAAERERRQRLVRLGAAVLFVAVIAVVALIALSGGGEGGDETIEGASAVDRELEGIDQSGTVLGDPDAPVTVREFADLQCPVCASFSEQEIPDVIDRAVRSGDARLEYVNFPILGEDSEVAARAALAAAEQDRMWQFTEIFYANQGFENSGYVTDEFLTGVAEAAGLDVEAWDEARQDPALDDQIAEAQAEAARLGFDGTPSMVVLGPGGEENLGTPSSARQVLAAIESAS
ncbi:MAG TPA: thioredoxin domain-containing protein [Solirubrobacterales bacterium]